MEQQQQQKSETGCLKWVEESFTFLCQPFPKAAQLGGKRDSLGLQFFFTGDSQTVSASGFSSCVEYWQRGPLLSYPIPSRGPLLSYPWSCRREIQGKSGSTASISPIIGKMQIKTTLRHHLTSVRMAMNKNITLCHASRNSATTLWVFLPQFSFSGGFC